MSKKKRKISIKKIFLRTLAVLAILIVLAVVIIDFSIRRAALPDCSVQSTSTAVDTLANADIKCPFLKIAKPTSTGWNAFARDCEKHGMDFGMALFVTIQTTWQQKGLWSVIRGEAPDIYTLDRVPGVSHCDLYAKYYDELEQKARAVEVNGQISLQDIVNIKKWIAELEGVEVMQSSKFETALIFGYAGGDLKTQKVYTNDVLLLVKSQSPTRGKVMNPTLLNEAMALANWD